MANIALKFLAKYPVIPPMVGAKDFLTKQQWKEEHVILGQSLTQGP